MRRFIAASAVAAAVLALAVAGCGSSSKTSSSSKSAAATATSATTTGATTSNALSKAQYEAKLGPLLNGRVVPALRGALTNGGARNPQKLKTAVGALNEAHDAMASITPPPKVADLNQQAVTVLASLSSDLSKMRSALLAKDKGAYANAAKGAVQDALKLQKVGNQLTARGY
ncbi:MAG: hypothetical protein ACTHQQ_01600 [Solirubrobacteraceae bacterium]